MKLRQMALTRIGVCEEWVLVDRGNGTVLAARDRDLLRMAKGFIIENVTISTGTPPLSLYDRGDMETWLQPRLDRAGLLGAGKQLAWQWQHQRGQFVIALLLVALGAVAVLGIELGWFQDWFNKWLQSYPACAEAANDGNVL